MKKVLLIITVCVSTLAFGQSNKAGDNSHKCRFWGLVLILDLFLMKLSREIF